MKRFLNGLMAALCALVMSGTALAAPFSAHYVFGDSLSDAGNLYAVTGGLLPQAGDYSKGHFSDGLSYAEIISASLGLAANPSYLGGTNYAVGGAMTDAHILGTPQANAAFSLQGQLASYFASHAVADANALYTVWIGSNDLFTALQMAGSGDVAGASQRVTDSVQDVAAALGQLVAAGARNVLLPNITDLGLTPRLSMAGAQSQAFASSMVQGFNAAIDQVAAQFSANVAGLNLVRFDTFGLLGEVVADPLAFGMSTDLSACIDGSIGVPSSSQCSDADQRVFWDDIHPTAATHQILASAMLVALVPAPGSLLLLGLALLILSVLRFWQRNKNSTARASLI